MTFFLSPLANQAWTAPFRAPMFVCFAASALAPLGKGLSMYGWDHMDDMVGLKWVLSEGSVYALGLAPFLVSYPAIRSPQCWSCDAQLQNTLPLTASPASMARARQTGQVRLRRSFTPAFSPFGGHCDNSAFRGLVEGIRVPAQPCADDHLSYVECLEGGSDVIQPMRPRCCETASAVCESPAKLKTNTPANAPADSRAFNNFE